MVLKLLSRFSMRATLAEVGGVPYYVPSSCYSFSPGTIQPIEGVKSSSFQNEDSQLVPVTLLSIHRGLSISTALEEMLRKDDVINTGFFQHLLISHDVETSQEGLSILAKTWRLSSIEKVLAQDYPLPRSGPYFFSRNTLALHQAWRLYDDSAATLVCPVHPNADDEGT